MKNSFLVGVLVIAGAILAGVFFLGRSTAPSNPTTKGVADSIGYQGVTNSSTTCSTATSTQIVGVQTGRTSFSAVNNGTNTVYLCKATSGCLANTGIPLVASGGSYEQDDGYIGGYSCIASGASSSLATTNSL